MSDTIIKVENLSKRYFLKHKNAEGYVALRDVITDKVKSFVSSKNKKQNPKSEEFWALQDVSFDIKQGERVGIIGRNGAGKSTLLKVLSRIVSPTTGRITIDGRVASLLEVGTGFHPELTGRENVFLNGSILGMSKFEIKRKFDEIVAFAEVEKFLDTPVKRYSSGMYVRLAFAVAAHLEPEILIVDEVLAVGDAKFQKKCLGKMEDVSINEGRTVLFVSHNMGQISTLCDQAMLLDKGRIINRDSSSKIIQQYYQGNNDDMSTSLVFNDANDKEIYFKSIKTVDINDDRCDNFAHDASICIDFQINSNQNLPDVLLGVHAYDKSDKRIFTTELPLTNVLKIGQSNNIKLIIPPNILTPNNYKFTCGLHIPNVQMIDEHRGICPVTIFDNGSKFANYNNLDYGCVFIDCKWDINSK